MDMMKLSEIYLWTGMLVLLALSKDDIVKCWVDDKNDLVLGIK